MNHRQFRELVGGGVAPPAWLCAKGADSMRRRVLRAHWEVPIHLANELALRDKCDRWLTLLTTLELLIASGHTKWLEAKAWVPASTWEALQTDEVQRYIDDYDCFSIRFLLSRLSEEERTGFLPLLPAREAMLADHRTVEAVEAFLRESQALQNSPEVKAALDLLDDFIPTSGAGVKEWRKCLMGTSAPGMASQFEAATNGARKWIKSKADSYRKAPARSLRREFALFDHYWLIKFFDCAISTSGKISPRTENEPQTRWMKLLGADQKDIDTLRGAWADANRKIQESSEEGRAEPQATGLTWREAFAEELAEVCELRPERDPGAPRPDVDEARPALTGLAFSGGGIRSATFGLGVLEALREMELLRHFDYLSTVSGGGYIGGWLAANTLRQPFWLRRGADWRASIQHLRKYSNYLSPKVGLLSADSWTMFAIWSRNTLLLQLLVFLSLALALMLPYLGKHIFLSAAWAFGDKGNDVARDLWEVAGCLSLAGASLLASWNLLQESDKNRGRTFTQGKTLTNIVLPYFGAAYVCAAAVWGQVMAGPLRDVATYGGFLRAAGPGTYAEAAAACIKTVWDQEIWSEAGSGAGCGPLWSAAEPGPWLSGLALTLVCLAGVGLWSRRPVWLLAAPGALAVFYLGLCGVALLFQEWRRDGYWMAFEFGPSLVLLVFTASMVIHIGLMGRSATDGQREWWSRLGAWFCIYGSVAAGLPLVAFLAPEWMENPPKTGTWPAIGAWLASTAGGVIAGRSAETNGSEDRSKIRKWAMAAMAAVAPPVFVAGLFSLSAWVVFKLLAHLTGAKGSSYWEQLDSIGAGPVVVVWCVCAAIVLILGYRVDINVFSLNSFYSYRLSRCYLGASRPRKTNEKRWAFTGFDPADDLELKALRRGKNGTYAGPIPIVNCAVNSGGSSDLSLHTRQGAAFTFTSLHAGSGWGRIGYAQLVNREGDEYCGIGHSPTLARVVSVSGAAANPNMGFHTSPAVAFLMTVFNMRLGAWFPNPGKAPYKLPSPRFAGGALARELFGAATEEGHYLNLSDGGHFENLGIYELARRRCKVIVASDAECDPDLKFAGLGNAIRLCETDLGARIDIDVSSIRRDGAFSRAHCAIGTILYDDGSTGYLIYLKASLTGSEETSIREYRDDNPDFPHETTGDQFFSEPQFESYRRLGHAICRRAFRDCLDQVDSSKKQPILVAYARELQKVWTPNLSVDGKFSCLGNAVQELWAELRQRMELRPLLNEIMQLPGQPQAMTPAIYAMTQEIFQLMENAYMDLAFGDTWHHPDHSGWRELFTRFARSPLMRAGWQRSKGTYGIRFQRFCQRWLELE